MSALPVHLQANGLPNQTLVVLGTEFGRKPRITDNDERDHHNAFTCLLAGVGINDTNPRGCWARRWWSWEPSLAASKINDNDG